MTTRPSVLFVCLHGSARSVIASAYFRRFATERGIEVETASAGTEPDAEIPSRVVQGLLGDGINIGSVNPRLVTRGDLEQASRVVVFGCELGDIAPPGLRVDRWGDVPAVSENYGRARDVIAGRVRTLLEDFASARPGRT
jgi:protein-tyrosine-phosphatase